MTGRPLRAVLLPAGPALQRLVAQALAGGPAVVPLDPTAPQLASWLRFLRPTTIVTAAGEEANPAGVGVTDDVAVLIATSGSTGAAKFTALSDAAVRASAVATLNYLNAASTDGWLCCLPAHHIAGFQVIVRALLAGAPIEWGSSLSDSSARFVSVVPTQLRRAVRAGVTLQQFRRILIGGAAVDQRLITAAEDLRGRLIATYGMSETAGGCVYNGEPLPGVGVRVDAEQRVWLRGPMLANGYHGSPTQTAAGFVDGEFRTSDRGEISATGTLRVLGRLDDVVNTGGVKISAAEVEAAIRTHSDIADVAVFGRTDTDWGHRVVAAIVGGTQLTLGEIRSIVEHSLGVAAAPRELIHVPALPLLGSGKVDRMRLVELPAGELWN